MDLFITTKVEMSTNILNYISDTTTLDEKCRRLEQSLKQTGQSITLHMTEQGKLELCGQWNDIVKTQDVLNKWIEYIKSRTDVQDLSEFIRKQSQLSETSAADGTDPQVAASASLQTCVMDSDKHYEKASDGLAPRKRRRRSKEMNSHCEPSTRPKRNVKHKILPLLKSKPKHFDINLSSESEDEDRRLLPMEIKREDPETESASVLVSYNADIVKSERLSESSSTNKEQVCSSDNEKQFFEAALVTDNKDNSERNEGKKLISVHHQVKHEQVNSLQTEQNVNENSNVAHLKITDPRIMDLIKKDGQYYYCCECPYKTLSSSNVRFHVARVHLPKAFKCDHCDKRYALHKDLVSHKTVHTKPHLCKFCGLSFSKPYLLRQHTRCRHEGTPKKRGRKPGTKNKRRTESVPLSCKHCDYVTFTNWNLVAHLRRVHAEKIYKCSECNSAFGLMKDLNQHKKSVHMSKFECNICKKLLRNAYSLKMHVKVIHEGVKLTTSKSYQCHLCGKVCRNKTDYTVHMNKLHLNIRPFRCEQCGMQFFAKGNLTAHQLIHSNEAKFVCSECGKRFKQRQGLRVHRYIHKSADDRPFKCASCNKTFTQQGALIRHQRVHSGFRPYLCKYDVKNCSAAFNDYSVLRRHLQGIHKVHDADELRRAVQRACDESREIISKQLEASSSLEGQDRLHSREGKDILYEQKLQSRNLKYNSKRREPLEGILVKVETARHTKSASQQLSSLQDRVIRPELRLITSQGSQIDLVSQTQQLQDFVNEFSSQMSIISSTGGKVQLAGSSGNSNMVKPLVMYLADDTAIKQEVAVAIQGDGSKERVPQSLEEAVSNALNEQQVSEAVSDTTDTVLNQTVDASGELGQVRDDVDLSKTSSVMDIVHSSMESILTPPATGQVSRTPTVALHPILNIQSLLQTPVRNTTDDHCQMLNLHAYSESQVLAAGGQQLEEEETARANTTEVVLEQIENPSGQVKVAILSDVGQQVLRDMDPNDETEHIIVITNLSGDQQPDINAILSMYQQGSTVMSDDHTNSVVTVQEQVYCTQAPASSNEAANVMMENQQL